MVLSELLALCDDENTMITIIREDGEPLEYGKAYMLYRSSHYPFYDVISFGVHNGELHICISAEPNPAEKERFYSMGRVKYKQGQKWTIGSPSAKANESMPLFRNKE